MGIIADDGEALDCLHILQAKITEDVQEKTVARLCGQVLGPVEFLDIGGEVCGGEVHALGLLPELLAHLSDAGRLAPNVDQFFW